MSYYDSNYLQRFRRAVGDTDPDNVKFQQSVVEDFFAEALEEHPDGSANAHLAYAVILGLNQRMTEAIEQVTYKANESSENLSDIRKGYMEAIAKWEKRLETALVANTTEVAVGWANMNKTPARWEEYPDA